MSITLMSLVWDRAPYEGGTLLVLLALADWANEEGVTWPSLAQLASKARMQVRNARYILRKLEDDQCIARESTGSGRATTVYRLNIQALQARPLAWKHPHHPTDEERGNENIAAPDSVPQQNLHEAMECCPGGQPIAALPGNDCRPGGHPIAALGGTPLPPNRHGTVKEPPPPPTPPAGAVGAGFSLPRGEGNGDNPSPLIHPPTPLSLSPPQDGDARGETLPAGVTVDDIRAFLASRWREEARRQQEGAPHAQGPHDPPDGLPHAGGAPDAPGLAVAADHRAPPGQAGPHPAPAGAGPGRLADCPPGRDQPPARVPLGGALPGARPPGPARPAPPGHGAPGLAAGAAVSPSAFEGGPAP